MKLIVESKPRADGTKKIKWVANLLPTGQIVSNDEDLLSQINDVYKMELQFLLKREPTGEELFKFTSENMPRCKLINEDGTAPVFNKEKVVKKLIRHGKDDTGFYSEIIETKEI